MKATSEGCSERDVRAAQLRRSGMEIGPTLDDAMARAWPPAVTETIDDWTLRYSYGVTRRANSVLTTGKPVDLGEAIAAGESFYTQRGAPPVFLVSDASTPSEVGSGLAERGYAEDGRTWIVHRDVDPSPPGSDMPSVWNVETSDTVTDGWFDAYCAVEGGRRGPGVMQVVRDVLLQPARPARFVTVGEQGSVLAVGQVVVVGETACAQCLATVPAGRRRGAGTAVIGALTGEAALLGARVIFGAVMADNEASLDLFDRLGYQRSHQYRYFVR